MSNALCLNPLVQLKIKIIPPRFPAKKSTKSVSISARLQNSQTPSNQQEQQLNLSVLRFTLGLSLSRWTCVCFSCVLSNLGLCPCFRDTWVWRVLLAQMDRVRVWFASDSQPFRGFRFCNYHSSTACERTLPMRSPSVGIIFDVVLLFFIPLCLSLWFLPSVEDRSSGPFSGSILYFNSISGKIS